MTNEALRCQKQVRHTFCLRRGTAAEVCEVRLTSRNSSSSKFQLKNAKLVLKAGKVDTVFGNFDFCKKEFAMTGIPMVTGHKPTVCIDKLCVRLQKIHATTMKLGPSFVLLLRILIVYAIAYAGLWFCGSTSATGMGL